MSKLDAERFPDLAAQHAALILKYAWLRSASIIGGAFKDGIAIDKAYDDHRLMKAVFGANLERENGTEASNG